MISTAVFSPCDRYRYTLTRIWEEGKPIINWIALNPSTADATNDDPTITREINFSKAWGYGGMIKTNLFALRSTDPKKLKTYYDPVGPGNDNHIRLVAGQCDRVMVAWGDYGSIGSRASWVYNKILKGAALYCLEVNKDGSPKHPLYVKGDRQPIPFTWKPKA